MHELTRQAHDLCMAIEQLPASKEQTDISLLASALLGDVIALTQSLADANKRAEAAEDVLRSLASFVGNGGYNAETVDAVEFEAKIRHGIDFIIQVEQGRSPRISDTEMMALLRRVNSEFEAKIKELSSSLSAMEVEQKKAREFAEVIVEDFSGTANDEHGQSWREMYPDMQGDMDFTMSAAKYLADKGLLTWHPRHEGWFRLVPQERGVAQKVSPQKTILVAKMESLPKIREEKLCNSHQ